MGGGWCGKEKGREKKWHRRRVYEREDEYVILPIAQMSTSSILDLLFALDA